MLNTRILFMQTFQHFIPCAELITELREFAPTFTEWASSEDDVIEPIMQSVSSSLESCAEEAEKNVKAHELEFLPPLKVFYFVLYQFKLQRVTLVGKHLPMTLPHTMQRCVYFSKCC